MTEGLLKIAGRWKQEMAPELQKMYEQLIGLKNRGTDPSKLVGQVHQFPPGFKKLVADRIFGSTPEPKGSFGEFIGRVAPLPKGPAGKALEDFQATKSPSSGFKWPLIAVGGALGLGGLGLLAAKLKERSNKKRLTPTAA